MKYKKLLSCLLALCMIVSVLAPAANAIGRASDNAYAPNKEAGQSQGLLVSQGEKTGVTTRRDTENNAAAPNGSWNAAEKENDHTVNLLAGEKECLKELRQAADLYADDEIVAAFIVMEEKPLIESYSKINSVPEADTNRLVSAQDKLIAQIEKKVLGGEKLNVRYQFTYLTNAISVRTAFSDLEAIAKLEGVKSVFLVPQYEPCTTENGAAIPFTAPSGDGTGVTDVRNELGYTGTGMTIAVIDTGLDLDHPSFVDAPETNENSLTVDDVAAVLDRLNAAEIKPGMKADQLYRGEKVPFAFNYVDASLTADHSSDYQGYHGTHVAGIAAANAIEDTSVVGMAPDAQLVVMKVFGAGGGAYNDDIVAALEDALVLDCDVVNLSLGSARGFTSVDPEMDAIYERIKNYDVVVTISAGNEGTSSYANSWGYDLNKTCDPDNSTVSSPSTFANATSIASADNFGLFTTYLTVNGTDFAYSDAIGLYAAFAELGTEPLEYVMVPGLGEAADYTGLDVSGKIAVVSRGTITFGEKLANAETNGAIGLIVYNNEPGTIGMQMADDDGNLPEGVSGMVPACSVTMAAGEMLANAAEKSVTLGEGVVPSEDGGQMSAFSSWGTTPDLRLVPDLTGIGGNVLSTADEGLYEVMSGTSMSAPQVAGVSALLLEYLHETFPNLTDGEYHEIANFILMSTAQPIISNLSSVEASPRQQGAGLVDAYGAVTTEGYLTVSGDRPKVELYDDPNKDGVYSFSFDIHNISDSAQTYTLSGSILTEDAVEYDGELYMAGYDRELSGEISFSKDSVTVKPGRVVRVNVTVTLSAESKAWLDENYANGGYVEGFIYAENENGVDLSLPYMGFYGDWTDAPIMDTAFWYDESFWYDGVEPTGAEYWHTLWTDLGGSDWVIGLNPYTGDPADMDPEHFVISNNADGLLDDVAEMYISLMRNAKAVTVTYADAETGEIYDSSVLEYVPKTMYLSSYGQIVPAIYSWYNTSFYDFTDAEGKPLPNNTKLTLTVSAVQDYDRHSQNPEGDSFTIPLTLDTEAPTLLDIQETATADGNYITVTFSDNVDPTAVYLLNATGTRIYNFWTELTENGDGTYSLTMDVTGMGTELQLILCDYGANERAYALSYTLDDNLPAVDTDALYGYRIHDESYSDDTLYGWVTIDTEDLTVTPQTSDYMEYYALTAAEYAGGYVFAVDAGYNFLVMVPGLWTRMEICNLGVGVLDMAFDKTTNTMYAVTKLDYDINLVTIDLITGEMETVTSYSSSYDCPWAFTIDDNGKFWCVKQYNSGFWTLDENWALVPVTDEEGNQITFVTADDKNAMPYYSQSMTYSSADQRIYWAYCSYTGATCLFTIDTQALTYTSAAFSNQEEFCGLLTIEDSIADYSCDGSECPSAKFEDIEADGWYHEGVDYVVANGYMNGTGATLFSPGKNLTRGMLVTILHRMAGEPETAPCDKFADVPADAYYAEAVAWAVENGITSGMSDTSFAPGVDVTREQMVTFLYRYVQLQGYDTTVKFDSLAAFADADTVSGYAVPAMKWAVGEGLVAGMTETLLAPKANATRGQFATILLRMYKEITGGYHIPASALTGLTIPENDVLLVVGSSTQSSVRPNPWNAKLGEITWSSGDESIATVSETGVITGVAEGNTVITASCGELTATVDVRVVELRGTVYAYNYYSAGATMQDWVSFDVGNISAGYTSLADSPVDFLAADYNGHDGYIYGYADGGQLYRYSPETGECSPMGTPMSGYTVMDMAYDYSTGFMYALTLDSNNYVSEICYVNMTNGQLISLGMIYNAYLTLACSTDGQLYGCCYDGTLSALNVTDYGIEEVPVIPGVSELYYQQSMCYDHNNDVIIWAYAEYSTIVWMDPATGDVLYLGDPTGSGTFEFTGLFTIPEEIEELPYVAVADAYAEDITVMVGAYKYPSVSVFPLNATNQSITWTSADPAIATVGEDGKITGVSVGTVEITGVLVDGENTFELSFTANVMASADNMYGFVLTDFATYGMNYWVSISDSDPNNPEPINSTMYTMYSEEYHDGKIYAYGFNADDWTGRWHFFILDAKTFDIIEDIELSEDFNYFVYDMTYDYTTGTMYAVAGPSDSASDLFIVNMKTGALIPCMTFDQFMMSIAAAPDGTLYAMATSTSEMDWMTWTEVFGNAYLYTLNVEEGTCDFFGDTGVKSNLLSSMTFDHDTGNLYWTALFRESYYSNIEGGLHLIDVDNGATAINLGNIGTAGAQVGGLVILADEYPAEPEPSLRSIVLDADRKVLGMGETASITATVMPVTLEGYSLEWTSSNPDVVSVDENGNIAGVNPGSATVTVTATWNEQTASASCEVTVLSEDAGYIVYNNTVSGWTKLERGDVTSYSQVGTDAEGDAAVLAADYVGNTIYGYDENGSFFSADDSFNRTVIGEGIIDLTMNPENNWIFQIRDVAYNPAAQELLVLGATVEADYDEEYAEWIYYDLTGMSKIYSVNMETGELTEVCSITTRDNVRGMTVSDDGTVYIYCPFDDYISTVDLTTGVSTELISLQSQSIYGSADHGQYMDYDSATGNVCLLLTSNGTFRQLITMSTDSLIITNLDIVGNGQYNYDTWMYESDEYMCLLVKN